MKRTKLLMIVPLFWLSQAAAQTSITYTVGTDAACDFQTIQAAIDVSDPADSTKIQVSIQKVWHETLDILNKERIAIRGGYLNCKSDVLSGNRTVIDASSDTFQAGINVFGSQEIYFYRVNIKNAKGGGVVIKQSKGNPFGSIYLFDVKLKDNSRSNFAGPLNGGGLTVTDDSRVFVDGSTIQNNMAANGGGVYCENSELSIQNPNILNNQTLAVDDDPSFGKGGGLYATNGCELMLKTFLSSTSTFGHGISGNVASFKGGGLFADGQAKIQLNEPDAFFKVPITFSGNMVNYTGNQTVLDGGGGALAAVDLGTEIIAYRLILTNNTVNSSAMFGGGGGALHLQFSPFFSMQLNGSHKPCIHILPTAQNNCNQISNNTTNKKGGMLYMDVDAMVTINQTFITENVANDHHLGGLFSGKLSMQGNVITHNGITDNPLSSELFYVGQFGKLQADFITFKDNHIPAGQIINGFQSKQIEMTRSIIDEASNTAVILDSSVTGTNITTFNCLLTHEDSSFNGQFITLGTPTYQPTWPYHLAANSLGVDMCNLSHSELTPEHDMDGDERGFCRGPGCASNPFRFDAGADEYRINDLIFKHGFD